MVRIMIMIEAIKMKISQESDDSRFAFFFLDDHDFSQSSGTLRTFYWSDCTKKKLELGKIEPKNRNRDLSFIYGELAVTERGNLMTSVSKAAAIF